MHARIVAAAVRVARAVLVLGAAVAGVACSPLYYLQAARGQLELLTRREPLEAVLASPSTDAQTRSQLLVVDAALVYAHAEIGMPSNDSYRSFVRLDRRYALWSVFAAPEFSLEPLQWCYPIVGCASYRGYFAEAAAGRFAARLSARGADVHVGGVPAYSTLGWFRDPVLSSMLGTSEVGLAGTIFHELAHQWLYVPGDTAFNESFASFVEAAATEGFLRSRNRAVDLELWRQTRARRAQVNDLLDQLRTELRDSYAAPLPDMARRAAKDAAFDATRRAYATLRSRWPGPPYFDRWFDADLNNALLAALGSYEELVPAFAVMFEQVGGSWPDFIERARELAALPAAERRRACQSLIDAGRAISGPRAFETDRNRSAR